MRKINFTKLVASGNDFILLDLRKKSIHKNLKGIAKQFCSRKFGVGADGLLVLEKSKKADVRMRIFNADGSEAEMCGNGARCAALYVSNHSAQKKIEIETKAGVLKAQVENNSVKINMTEPKNINLGLEIKISGRTLRANFINTGVPHVVILCEGLEKIDAYSLGRLIRFHNKFKPQGTNVNFIEPESLGRIKIRTYERGVEEETLACGTGSVASAVIYALKLIKLKLIKQNKIKIFADTASGETLMIYFDIDNNKIKNVWLEGEAKIVFAGEYNG